MGEVVDYFRPTTRKTLCNLLVRAPLIVRF